MVDGEWWTTDGGRGGGDGDKDEGDGGHENRAQRCGGLEAVLARANFRANNDKRLCPLSEWHVP